MRWKLLIGLGLAFVFGGVAGVMIGVRAERQHLRQFDSPTAEAFTDVAVRRLEKELKLTPQQTAAVRGVYESVAAEVIRIEKTRRSELLPLVHKMRPQIEAVLDDEQRGKFRKLADEVEKRLKLRDTD